jgi:hypothetical protein
MGHLKPEQLVDLAEGTSSEREVRHLDECETCQSALAELRAAMLVASPTNDVDDVSDVPEPSPLFWDHLSARVRESVAAKEAPRPSGRLERWLQPRIAIPLCAAMAAAVIIVAIVSRKPDDRRLIPATPLPLGESAQLPSLPPLEPLGTAGDPSLDLLADYGTGLAWDDMREEMGPVTHPGGTDEAVTTLSAEERQELQRLLEEEMTQPTALGAS